MVITGRDTERQRERQGNDPDRHAGCQVPGARPAQAPVVSATW